MTGLLLAALLGQAVVTGAAALLPGAAPVLPVASPLPAPSAEDEEVIRNLELLDRLDLLRHAELFDDGALSDREASPPSPPPPAPPPSAPLPATPVPVPPPAR